jgi:membrane protein YdbS with pleckstrin-like domain
MKNSSNSGNGGVGLLGLLTVAFVVLKLTGVIAWSWWWVLAPAWIPLAVGLVITVIVMIVGIVAAVGKKG